MEPDFLSQKSDPSQSRKTRFLAFIRKHKHIVTLSSAFVVLGSFLVKEVWAAHLKDLSDVLVNAQERFERQEQELEILHALEGLQRDSDAVQGKLVKDPNRNDYWITMNQRRVDMYYRGFRFYCLSAGQIIGKLGNHSMQDVADEGELRMTFERGEREYWPMRQAFVQTTRDEDRRSIINEWWFLEENSQYQFRKAVDKAMVARALEQRKNAIAERVSYALFAIGWILGVMVNTVEGKAAESSSDS